MIIHKKIHGLGPFISAAKNLHFNNNVIMPSYSRHFEGFSSTPGVLVRSAEGLDVAVFSQQMLSSLFLGNGYGWAIVTGLVF